MATPLPLSEAYADSAVIRDILSRYRRIATVGASPKPERPSYGVMRYLLAHGYQVVPVNPGHAGGEILGQSVYAALGDIPEPVEVVDVFRQADAACAVAEAAIAAGAKALWLQIGVVNIEAARLAESAGLCVVMNRCMKIEYQRLFDAAE